MASNSGQWLLCAALLVVFSALTVAGRWLDLGLALTLGAVIWYGIVPVAATGDNNAKAAKNR